MPIRDQISEIDEDVVLSDGFEMAFVGLIERFPGGEPVALYDRAKCIKLLMSRDGMSEEGAEEFFEFNVMGSYVGERTPWFITWRPSQQLSRPRTSEDG